MPRPIEVIDVSRRDLFKYAGVGAIVLAQGYNPQLLQAPFNYQGEVNPESHRIQPLSVATQVETNPHLYRRPTNPMAEVLEVGILFVPDRPGIRVSPTWENDLGGNFGEVQSFFSQKVPTSRWSFILRIIPGDKTIGEYKTVQEIDAEVKSKLAGDVVRPDPLTHLIRHTYIGCRLSDLYYSLVWNLFGGGLDEASDGFVVDAKYYADFLKQGYTYGTIRAAQGTAFGLGMTQPWMDRILNPSRNQDFGNTVGNLFYRGYAPIEKNFRLSMADIMDAQKQLLGAPYPRARFPLVFQAQPTQQQ